jgi:hypothetical protein
VSVRVGSSVAASSNGRNGWIAEVPPQDLERQDRAHGGRSDEMPRFSRAVIRGRGDKWPGRVASGHSSRPPPTARLHRVIRMKGTDDLPLDGRLARSQKVRPKVLVQMVYDFPVRRTCVPLDDRGTMERSSSMATGENTTPRVRSGSTRAYALRRLDQIESTVDHCRHYGLAP